MMRSKKHFPNPGFGYTIRSYLGGGNHKDAYRASSLHQARDVALLYFKSEKTELIVHDFEKLLRVRVDHPDAQYIAQLIGYQTGKDGKPYLIEELLARPLDRLGIVDDLIQFVRIARDLSRGLAFLHSIDLIHRDLKLDNCGIDNQNRAKIFDLGCLTTDPGDVKGNIFTREPDLFRARGRGRADKASDVWALGATLFALRTGDYPFVSAREVEQRRKINADFHDERITNEEMEKKKEELARTVARRATAKGAEQKLRAKIQSTLRETAEGLLSRMLDFNSTNRMSAQYFSRNWSELASRLGSGSLPETQERSGGAARDPYPDLEKFLSMVERREISITEKQLERLASDVDPKGSLGSRLSASQVERIEGTIKRIKRRRILADLKLSELS